MFALSIQNTDHVRLYSVHSAGAAGWEVCIEEDFHVRRLVRYRDWHRVERAIASFEREVTHLTTRGWRIVERDVTGAGV
jgi:hypothetical protein